MDRDTTLALVRTLTRPVLELFAPSQVEEFDDDFADWTLSAGSLGVSENSYASYGTVPPGRGLDTTLVAGMFFQVMLESSRLPASTRNGSLSSANGPKTIWSPNWPGRSPCPNSTVCSTLSKKRWGSISPRMIGREASLNWWKPAGPGLSRSWSKATPCARPWPPSAYLKKAGASLSAETLGDFLRETEGRWFRLLDFESRFQVNKKTAWGYLNLLLQEGILVHNGEKANRVRYALAGHLKTSPTAGPPV